MNVNRLARTIKLLDLDYYIERPKSVVVEPLNVNAKVLAISPRSSAKTEDYYTLGAMLKVLNLKDTDLSIASTTGDPLEDFIKDIVKLVETICPKKIIYFYDSEQRPLEMQGIIYIPHPVLFQENPSLKRQSYNQLLELAKEL